MAVEGYYFSIMSETLPPQLDAASAAFICSGLSINAASGRAGAIPDMARAVGCRVAPDYSSVTVLFASTPAAALIDAVRRSGAIAVVFSQPSTHRTLQLKGSDARIVPPEAGDLELTRRYAEAFDTELSPFGYPDRLILTLLEFDPGDLVGVCFTPSSIFLQTPGPSAGEPLKLTQAGGSKVDATPAGVAKAP
jgi:hypothetical protein